MVRTIAMMLFCLLDSVPDSLGNLKRLSTLSFQRTRINNITSQLTTLRYLQSLSINQCELPKLPNLSEMENLHSISLSHNRLSQILGLNGPYSLTLQNNNFTELPTLTTPETLQYLSIDNNPLKHIMPISSFINLENLQLSNTPITFIPPTIEKLQNLRWLYLSYTKLSYLPQNILKLTKLIRLYAQGNLFDTNELSFIRQKFNQTLPNCTLYL
jgi:Leucine-rich repeat (LRR) protein